MILRKLTIFFCILLLTACDKEEAVQTPIDSDILIQVKEVTSGGSGRIMIIGKTAKGYNCYNYNIATTEKFTNNTTEITFKAVEEDEICATALGPATAEIDLGTLDNGEYTLQLNTTTDMNKGMLKVTATEIRLEFNQQKGIAILTPVVRR